MKMDKQALKGSEYLIKPSPAEEIFTPEDFSDEQRQIAETTTEFVENEILPHQEEIDAGNFDLRITSYNVCYTKLLRRPLWIPIAATNAHRDARSVRRPHRLSPAHPLSA